jgi:2-keto-3-deoxy-6-phosphogluconate aldolase
VTPVITWTTPAAIPYGTALSAAQLDATASVPGTFAYSPSAGTVLAAGAQTLSVTFTPTDTTD